MGGFSWFAETPGVNDTSSRSSRGDVERLNLALATGSHFAMVIDTYSHEHEVPQT